MYNFFKTFKEITDKTDSIYNEVKPNGGASLRDSINRIEDYVSILDQRILSQASLRDAFREDGPIGIFECDKEGRNTYSNRTYCRWCGCTKGELMGYGWRNFTADWSAREEYDEEWKEGFDEEREVEFTLAIKNQVTDEVIYVNVHAYPIFGKDKKLEKYLGLLYKVESEKELFNRNT